MNKREEQIKEFMQGCLEDYPVLKYEITINDNSEDDYTDFEITVTNDTNDKESHTILRCWDYQGGIEILRGEDFYGTDEKDFIMELFLTEFLTLVEA